MATGHYARIMERDGRFELWRASDHAKDQSYILYTLTQEDLAHILFPLGSLTKTTVRALAAERGLATAHKPDSQELCFVPQNDYRRYLEEHRPEAVNPGEMVDTAGQVIGSHRGIAFYTVGQRRGLGLSSPIPLYVVGVEPQANRVIVGSREEALASGFTAVDVNYPDLVDPKPFTASVKVRSGGEPAPCFWEPLPGRRARITWDEKQWAMTPGQVACAFQGDHLVAGGRIAETFPP